MNILRFFVIFLTLRFNVYAELKEPRLSAGGRDYRVSIYEDTAVIERLTDGEKKVIKGLLWGSSDLQKSQPKKFFDDESNSALFLMDLYHYTLVNIEELFKGEEEGYGIYENIEGGVFKSPYVVDRTNTSWSLDGIYPEGIIKGQASNAIGKLDFTLDVSKRWGRLVTTNKKSLEIIALRVIDGDCENRFIYYYE